MRMFFGDHITKSGYPSRRIWKVDWRSEILDMKQK